MPTRARAFIGSIVLGMGFTFDDTDKKGIASPITRTRAEELAKSGERPISMEELIAKDPRNQERIFPYIGGKEVNDSPTQAHHRYVINFEQMSEEEASDWPDLMRIVEEKVKPETVEAEVDDVAISMQMVAVWRTRSGTLQRHPRAGSSAGNARVSDAVQVWLSSSGMVYSEQLVVFHINDRFAAFAVLQSRPHELWARFFGSSLEDRPSLHPLRLLRNLPLPRRLGDERHRWKRSARNITSIAPS